MQVIETSISGLIELIPVVYPDNRGWFYEFYKEETFQKAGINQHFPQENISYSLKNVIRGLHFQLPPFAQAKMVTVLKGRVVDVVVDLRSGSPTFGKVYYCELSAEKHNWLFVPEGFAHGFAALEDSIFYYKCTNVYNKASEGGIRWNDPDLAIEWPVSNPIVSDKDMELPTLADLLGNSLISH